MDNFNEDEEEINEDEGFFIISDFDKFIYESYVFSYLNLTISLRTEVYSEKNPIKREELKEKLMSEIMVSEVDKEEIDDMLHIYPMKDAVEIIEKMVLTNDQEQFYISSYNLMKATEKISKEMLYALFKRLEKEDNLELYWDSKIGDFAYGPKTKKSKDETKIVNKIRKDKKTPTKKRKPKDTK